MQMIPSVLLKQNHFWLSQKIIHTLTQSDKTVRILPLISQLLFPLVVVLFVEVIHCRLNATLGETNIAVGHTGTCISND